MNANTKAAIWARVSTDRQETDNQLRILREMAARRGLEVAKVYTIEASAWTGRHRQQLTQAINEGRAGEFSVLLLWALDRLSREGPLEMLKAVDSFGKAGVRVISYEEPWTEVSNEMLDLLLAITGWVARQESRRKSERVKIGMERARAEGKHMGRPARSRAVEDHPRFGQVAALVAAGHLTVAEGARKLKVRRADFGNAVQKGRSTEDLGTEFEIAV
jgi:putative DNA-invertase from lambdoid prophage Rac